MSAIENRYEFVLLFDVENGNPNGDPDAGNMPRIDPETNHGLVTDVCLKRKVRNFVQLAEGLKQDHDIFVKEKAVLNSQIRRPYEEDEATKEALALWEAWKKNKKLPKPSKHYEDVAKEWMCKNFYDVRTFGAVMSTGDKEQSDEDSSKIRKTAGQVRGPVQLAFARSIEPVTPLDVTITRMAVANEKDAEAQGGDNRTMGRKHIVPYGLYRAEGFISAPLAAQTGFSDADLELFWQALTQMFDHDHSAARGKMSARRLIVFKHDSALGSAPAHKLFDLVKVARATDASAPARTFADYAVSVDKAGLPQGVTLEEKI
jgi:CRISPR-associated protein Csd2